MAKPKRKPLPYQRIVAWRFLGGFYEITRVERRKKRCHVRHVEWNYTASFAQGSDGKWEVDLMQAEFQDCLSDDIPRIVEHLNRFGLPMKYRGSV